MGRLHRAFPAGPSPAGPSPADQSQAVHHSRRHSRADPSPADLACRADHQRGRPAWPVHLPAGHNPAVRSQAGHHQAAQNPAGQSQAVRLQAGQSQAESRSQVPPRKPVDQASLRQTPLVSGSPPWACLAGHSPWAAGRIRSAWGAAHHKRVDHHLVLAPHMDPPSHQVGHPSGRCHRTCPLVSHPDSRPLPVIRTHPQVSAESPKLPARLLRVPSRLGTLPPDRSPARPPHNWANSARNRLAPAHRALLHCPSCPHKAPLKWRLCRHRQPFQAPPPHRHYPFGQRGPQPAQSDAPACTRSTPRHPTSASQRGLAGPRTTPEPVLHRPSCGSLLH